MKTKTKKAFDSVKMMRAIRNKIDQDLKGKSSEEILKYYEERRKIIAERKRAKR